MATKVKTPYIGNFSFPHACVACGNPPNPGMNWKVSGSKSSRNRKRTTFLSLEFPLCQECYTVSRNRRSANLLPWLIVPLSIVGICGLASQMSRAFGNLAAMVLSGIVFIAVVLLLIWLGEKINQQGFTPEQRERRKRVQQCATISSFQEPSRSEKFGSIVFKFENPGFASEFSRMNLGEIGTPGRQDSSGKRSLSSTIMVILAACVLGGTFYLADMYKDSPEAFAKFFAGLYKNTPESFATAAPADTPTLMATPWTVVVQDTPAPGEGQVSQFATGATASSQYSETGWSALQAVGAPDTAGCGDIRSAWASLHSGTEDWLLLRYDQPVIPIRIVIYQTYHPGAVSRVEVVDEAGNSITVYEADPTIIGQCPQTLEIEVRDVNRLVRSVKVTIDQSIHNDWSEIDAVQLFGKPE